MKKFFILTISILILFVSCDVDFPEIVKSEIIYIGLETNNRYTFKNDFFNDSINIFFNAWTTDQDIYTIRVKVVNGGGSINQSEFQAAASTGFKIKWKAGILSTIQSIKATVYNSKGKYITSNTLNCYAFSEENWDVVSNDIKGQLNYMTSDQHGNTIAIFNNSLYQNTDTNKYFIWQPVSCIKDVRFTKAEFDANGSLLAISLENKLYKINLSDSTFSICKDFHTIIDNITTTSDGRIWISSRSSKLLYFSDDFGKTWNTSQTPINFNYLYHAIYLTSDNKYLTMDENTHQLLVSEDGIIWTVESQLDIYTLSFYVTNDNKIITFAESYDCSFYESSDMGKTFSKIKTIDPEFGTSTVHKMFYTFNDKIYMCIPGYGVMRTTDFESFDIIAQSKENHFYISATGLILGTNIVNYQNYHFYYKTNLF